MINSAAFGALHNQYQNEKSTYRRNLEIGQLSLGDMKAHLMTLKVLLDLMEQAAPDSTSFGSRDLHLTQLEIQQKEQRLLRSAIDHSQHPFYTHSGYKRSCSLFEMVPFLYSYFSYLDLCQAARTNKIWHQKWKQKGDSFDNQYKINSRHLIRDVNLGINVYLETPLPSWPSEAPLFMHTYQQALQKLDKCLRFDSSVKRPLGYRKKFLPSEIRECQLHYHHYCQGFTKRKLRCDEFGNYFVEGAYSINSYGERFFLNLPKVLVQQVLAPYLSLQGLAALVCVSKSLAPMHRGMIKKMYDQLVLDVKNIQLIYEDNSEYLPLYGVKLPPFLQEVEAPSLDHLENVLRNVEVTVARRLEIFTPVYGERYQKIHFIAECSSGQIISLFSTCINRVNKRFAYFLKNFGTTKGVQHMHTNHYPEIILDNCPLDLSLGDKREHHDIILRASLYDPYKVLAYLQRVYGNGTRDSFEWNGMSETKLRSLIKASSHQTWQLVKHRAQDVDSPRFLRNFRYLEQWFVQLVEEGYLEEAFELVTFMKGISKEWNVRSVALQKAMLSFMRSDIEITRKAEGTTLYLSKAVPNQALDYYLSLDLKEWEDLVFIKDVILLKQILDLADTEGIQKAKQIVADPTFRNDLHDRLLEVVRERGSSHKRLQGVLVHHLITKAQELGLFRWHRNEQSVN